MNHSPAPIPEEVKKEKRKFTFGIKKSKSEGNKLDSLFDYYTYKFSCKNTDNLIALFMKRQL